MEATTLTIQLLVKFRKSHLLRESVRPKGEVGRSIKKKTSAITVSLTKSYHISENEDFNIDLIFVFSILHVFKI